MAETRNGKELPGAHMDVGRALCFVKFNLSA